ncbi:MAG: DUF5309 family protein [Planctomycetota bacterium]
MAFTGKATYDGGAGLPELAEDVSDVIGIVSPHETPLLDHLGDARRAARSTVHEWLEDALHPNFGFIDQTTFSPSPTTATQITVDDGDAFRIGDQVRAEGSDEVMLVVLVSGNLLTVSRGYGGTSAEALSDDLRLHIIGNAALEGDGVGASRATTRVRRWNYTQILRATVEVSGSQRAVETIGVRDELDYQMQERLREMLRDLESSVIGGVAATTSPEGSSNIRRTMNGIRAMLETNIFEPGMGDIPDGGGGGDELTEAVLNAALRAIWEQSSGTVDTIVVGGAQKRRVNSFIGDRRGYTSRETSYRDLVSIYESDYGVCRVVLSRWTPVDSVLLLDSSRISVLPLAGRSFHFKQLAATGDSDVGQVIGEYTLEMMNENAHGVITNLAA